MSGKLQKHSPRIIFNWGVCDQFKNPVYLGSVICGGKTEVNALDVLEMPIRPVDKLWVLMRVEFTPKEVLDNVASRILELKDVPDVAKTEVKEPKKRGERKEIEHLRLAPEALSEENYWDVCRHVAGAKRYLGVRSYEEEYPRILEVYREELENYLKK